MYQLYINCKVHTHVSYFMEFYAIAIFIFFKKIFWYDKKQQRNNSNYRDITDTSFLFSPVSRSRDY